MDINRKVFEYPGYDDKRVGIAITWVVISFISLISVLEHPAIGALIIFLLFPAGLGVTQEIKDNLVYKSHGYIALLIGLIVALLSEDVAYLPYLITAWFVDLFFGTDFVGAFASTLD